MSGRFRVMEKLVLPLAAVFCVDCIYSSAPNSTKQQLSDIYYIWKYVILTNNHIQLTAFHIATDIQQCEVH